MFTDGQHIIQTQPIIMFILTVSTVIGADHFPCIAHQLRVLGYGLSGIYAPSLMCVDMACVEWMSIVRMFESGRVY